MTFNRRTILIITVSFLSMIIPIAIIIGILKTAKTTFTGNTMITSKITLTTSISSTITTPFNCPSPFVQNGTYCYYLSRMPTDQASSKTECKMLNPKSKLISIDDEAEFDAVKEYLKTANENGCEDSEGAFTCGFYKSSTWTWQETGSKFDPGAHLIANPPPVDGDCMTIQLPNFPPDAYKYIPVHCTVNCCQLCEI